MAEKPLILKAVDLMFDYQLVARGQGVRVGCFPEQQLIVTKPEPLP